MEPRIQYAKTEDGVSIAYCVQGEGPPLVLVPYPMSDIAAEPALEDMGRWLDRMGRSHTLIRYDCRGCGSSDRNALLDSMDAWRYDLASVLSAVALDTFDIYAQAVCVPGAITYAARRPEGLRRLILWDGFARSVDHEPRVGIVATRGLIQKDWHTYTNAWAQAHFGWANAALGKAWASFYRHATTPENVLASLAAIEDVDLTELLPKVTAKTLVIGHHIERMNLATAKRFLAASLPDAHLVVREGLDVPPWAEAGGVEDPARLIDEFTDAPPPSEDAVPPGQPGATAIILFADIASSTALTEQLGDAAFREKARALDDALRTAITSAGGSAVEGKLLGDGVLAIFGAAREAIACASACHAAGSNHDLQLHVGIHAGDVIREDGNVFGGAVNIAARVSDASGAAETFVSATVRDLARTSAGVSFEDRGEHALKGIDEPHRLFAVREQA